MKVSFEKVDDFSEAPRRRLMREYPVPEREYPVPETGDWEVKPKHDELGGGGGESERGGGGGGGGLPEKSNASQRQDDLRTDLRTGPDVHVRKACYVGEEVILGLSL